MLHSSAIMTIEQESKNHGEKYGFSVICVSAQKTSKQDGLLRYQTVTKVTHPQIMKFNLRQHYTARGTAVHIPYGALMVHINAP